ncbi:MAG: hypothetical protein MCS20_01945, partial [Candidatus Phytoplasma mali]|nr:hypothetical protein [Candidatus Phytoplasma australiense]MBZ7920143.1 hypothetical protein [Candidatus Karelsulcia muelleri]MCG7202152.1 hypothetical protein [Candidatus Phytoplasma mali]
ILYLKISHVTKFLFTLTLWFTFFYLFFIFIYIYIYIYNNFVHLVFQFSNYSAFIYLFFTM